MRDYREEETMSVINKNINVQFCSSTSFEKIELEWDKKRMDKKISGILVSMYEKNIENHTPSLLNLMAIKFNFIDSSLSDINLGNVNSLYKNILFSCVVFGNSIMSADKSYCKQMVRLVEYLSLDVDIMYLNKSTRKIEYLNDKR